MLLQHKIGQTCALRIVTHARCLLELASILILPVCKSRIKPRLVHTYDEFVVQYGFASDAAYAISLRHTWFSVTSTPRRRIRKNLATPDDIPSNPSLESNISHSGNANHLNLSTRLADTMGGALMIAIGRPARARRATVLSGSATQLSTTTKPIARRRGFS
jgi:hypothetical protein